MYKVKGRKYRILDIMRFSFSDDEKEKWRLLRPGGAFMDKNDILLVTTFGGFSMTWNGRNLTVVYIPRDLTVVHGRFDHL